MTQMTAMPAFQDRAVDFSRETFGPAIAFDVVERALRLLEEANEVAQAAGATLEEVIAVARYVFSRKTGEMSQEIGGLMVQLALMAETHSVDMDECAERELSRCWRKADHIAARQDTKPDLTNRGGPASEARQAARGDKHYDWMLECEAIDLASPGLRTEAVLASQWPDEVEPGAFYRVPCDDKGHDGGSWLQVMVSPADSDVHLMMMDWDKRRDEQPNPIPCLRIRTHAGGGRNRRTRQALLWLCAAMAQDAQEDGSNASVLPPAS